MRSKQKEELEVGRMYMVGYIKPGHKNATTVRARCLGFYDSPSQGKCAELRFKGGTHVIPLSSIKRFKEVVEKGEA